MQTSSVSIQINFTSALGALMTRCATPATALDVAKELHDAGHTVGSVAWYVYPKRGKIRTIAVWYGTAKQGYYS